MAGQWESTGHPGVEKQPILGMKNYRYRARFRVARGKVTSKTFDRLKDARDYLGVCSSLAWDEPLPGQSDKGVERVELPGVSERTQFCR